MKRLLLTLAATAALAVSGLTFTHSAEARPRGWGGGGYYGARSYYGGGWGGAYARNSFYGGYGPYYGRSYYAPTYGYPAYGYPAYGYGSGYGYPYYNNGYGRSAGVYLGTPAGGIYIR